MGISSKNHLDTTKQLYTKTPLVEIFQQNYNSNLSKNTT